ncbi:MAG: hypothetical protein OXB88_07275 [Bacteriovoracales bacterium]|nr:hypothetical protein [Bacteriovoracales bacterium]
MKQKEGADFSLKGSEQNRDLVEKIYQACNERPEDNNEGEPTKDCIKRYSEDHENEFKEFREKANPAKESISIRGGDSVSRTLLREYLDTRFNEKVLGKKEGEKGNQNLVDHVYFFEFYQSQLSKSAMMVMSSHCLKTDPTQEKDDIINNLQDEPTTKTFFEECILTIAQTCHPESPSSNENSQSQNENPQSQKREACDTLGKLRKINRALTANQKRIHYFRCQKEFKDKEHCGKKSGFDVTWADESNTPINRYNPLAKGQSIDDLTSFTSAEFEKNIIQKIEEVCPQNSEPSEECLAMLKLKPSDSNANDDERQQSLEDEKNKALTEFDLQSHIVQEKIAKYKKEDLARKLASEGAEEEIAQAIRDAGDEQDTKIEELRDEMEARYVAERKALREKLVKRFKDETEKRTQKDKFDLITKRNKDIKDVLFFNNIVSGYLSIYDNNTKETLGRNLASFQREIDSKSRLPLDEDQEALIEALNKQLQKFKQERSSKGQKESNPTLSPGQIHKNILKEGLEFDEKSDAERTNN